jgi:glycosyltransferase involved in cell wall biosynthesis
MDRSNFEVIVSDDGSSDNTLEVVKKYEDKLNLKYLFQEDKGYRPASARNAGITESEGTVCLLVDCGVLLNVNCLDEHYRFHIEKGRNAIAIGYVYGFDQGDGLFSNLKRLVVPDQPQESIRRISKDKLFYDVREYHYTTYEDRIHDLPAPWLYFWTCHVSIRKEDLLIVGLFDTIYDGRWGCEDNDLGFRLFLNGGQFYLLRDAESIHYPHDGDWVSKVEQGYQNCILFHNKFQTLETKVFLDTYKNEIFTDINAICMRMRLAEKV